MADEEQKRLGRENDSLANTQTIRRGLSSAGLSQRRLAFLAKLPVFLNSSLSLQRVAQISLEHILDELEAEFAVVYLKDNDESVTYWSLVRSPRQRSEGDVDLAQHPCAQLAMKNCFPLVLQNKEEFPGEEFDSCFGHSIDNLICIPLTVREKECVGAFQISNMNPEIVSDQSSLVFCDQFAHQLAFAIDNARLYQEAESHRQKLVALDQKKSETISIIAHEFRTPLNIIQNAAELLTSELLTNENRGEMVSLLQTSVQRLTRLIAQIRNVSLVQDESIPIELECFDMSRLVSIVVEKFQKVAANRSLQLVAHRPNMQLDVLGEPRLLSVVLQNLISNAVRFTPDGGTVIVQLEEEGDDVRLTVVDTGIGISQDEQQLIFEKFYEVKDCMLHSSGEYEFQSSGLGLGLAAVKHILSAHNTEVELESEPDKGSRFSFKLTRPPQ